MPGPGIGTVGAEDINTGKKALFITGASGFLGARILEFLEPGDYSCITLLSRRPLELPAKLAASDNTVVVQGSIHSVDQYASLLDSGTIVLHLAAMTGKAEPAEYYRVNAEGTEELLKVSVERSVAGFLFISSIAVSFSDRAGYHYAESKQLAEQKVRESGLNFTIVRPTIILGEGSPIWDNFSGLSKRFVILLPGSGKTMIQPVDIDDAVSLLMDIVSSGRFTGETLELGGPEILSMDDFVLRIHRAYHGKQGHIVHLPLGMILSILRLFEKWFPSLLPVSSGQFASFNNDGTAGKNGLCPLSGNGMKTIDDMLEHLTGRS